MNLTKRLMEKILNWRISTKMIAGYFLLIVLPFAGFAVFVYYQLTDKLVTQYQLGNQRNIEQIAANLDSALQKIESIYSIFQNNAALIDFLRGEYTTDRDHIYAYLKEIRPAYSFAYLVEPSVTNLKIYPKLNSKFANIPGFGGYDTLERQVDPSMLSALTPARGRWHKDFSSGDMKLNYYRKIYNMNYNSELGILQISVDTRLLRKIPDDLHSLHADNELLLLDEDNRLIYKSSDISLTDKQMDAISSMLRNREQKLLAFDQGRIFINSVTLPRLGLTIVVINSEELLLKVLLTKRLWIFAGLILLIVLSVIYYLIISSLTKRILLLSRHMRKVGISSVSHPFTGKIGTDEIGFLISSYNAMISRIDELVNRVQKVELLKKDAEFKMLQAQIRPHFLYNTLETIRMLARSNKQHTIAEMAFSLGNLLRYSLSGSDETTLREELENVRAYIAIHQIRMRDLHVEWYLDESLLSTKCPKFILQPIVENSMIHGLSKKRGEKRITIRLYADHLVLTVVVADNGAGIDPIKLSTLRKSVDGMAVQDQMVEHSGKGIGLRNVVERIKAFFADGSGIQIESGAGAGTTVTLRLILGENDHVEAADCG